MKKIFQMVFFVLISINAFADPAKLLFAEINKNKLRVIEMKIDGSNKTIIYENNEIGKSGPFPIAFKDELLLFQSETSFIYDLKKKEMTKLDCSENCYVIGFFKTKPYIVLETGPSMENSQVVIYDYNAKTKVKEYPDRYTPRIATADDTVFSQKYRKVSPDEIQSHEGVTGYIDIYRVGNDITKEELVRTIELSEHYRYNVTEISAFSKDLYAYRIYDEHEYRYYVYTGKEELPFYNTGHGYDLNHESREQYDLKFSANGKYAAYAERPWNELSSIIAVDMKTKKAIDTGYKGSFPVVIDDYIAFISDSEFIKTKDFSFRQIKNYAIYAYDIKSKTCKQIYKCKQGGLKFIDE